VPTPHPLSEDFAWEDHHGPFRAVTDAQAAAYDELGYFVAEGLLDATTVAAVTAAIDPAEAATESAIREGTDDGRVFIYRAGEITFTTHLVAQSEALRDLVSSPPLRDVAVDLLGPTVRLYWDQAVYKKPGTESPFPWHQDNGYTFVLPQQYLTTTAARGWSPACTGVGPWPTGRASSASSASRRHRARFPCRLRPAASSCSPR
jgi:ectoine hydroxylase-related dioxygenase (phytanoyl-CoA dioxygenase family)